MGGFSDEMIAEAEAEKEQRSQIRLKDNVKMSLDVDAERRLKAETLAGVLGEQDIDFVERNYGLLDRDARTRGLYKSLPDNSVTKSILSISQERAMLPDGENLAKVEQTIVNDIQKVVCSRRCWFICWR